MSSAAGGRASVAKYEAKTKQNAISLEAYLASVDAARQEDTQTLIAMMREITGEEPVMWGASIIGFGKYAYRYKSGHGGEAPIIGFSPRKAALSLYLSSSFARREALLAKLGKHSIGKACLYIKSLSDVDLGVLHQMIADSVVHVRAHHGNC